MSHPIQYLEPYDMAAQNKAIDFLYQKQLGLKSEDFPSRVATLSASLLGRPYLEGAAGEGKEGFFDQLPLYRFDVFDCVTFVNTVLALALSHDVSSFQKNLVRINYRDARPAYQYRHHFMSVDWNVHNATMGILKDITKNIVNEKNEPIAMCAQTVIDRPNWFKHRRYEDIKLLKKISTKKAENLLNELQALSKAMMSEMSNMPYLPLTALYDENANPRQALFDQIPHGAIIEVVRPNWNIRDKIGTNLNVSHVGFAIRQDDELYYRQASSIEKCVMDIPLTEYLKYRLESPSVKGVHVQELLDQ